MKNSLNIIEKYINLLEMREEKEELYIYHYTLKENLKMIKKNGLLSMYGLYKKEPKIYEKTIADYLERIKRKGYEIGSDIDSIENYFRKRKISTKFIYFSFWKIEEGLHKGRDEFMKGSIVIKINIKNLQRDWKYHLIHESNVTDILLKNIKEFCTKDSLEYQKKKGGRFLFSNIPHLAIETNNGIIPLKYLEIEKG